MVYDYFELSLLSLKVVDELRSKEEVNYLAVHELAKVIGNGLSAEGFGRLSFPRRALFHAIGDSEVKVVEHLRMRANLFYQELNSIGNMVSGKRDELADACVRFSNAILVEDLNDMISWGKRNSECYLVA